MALLDTGATYTLIDEERVQSINLKSGIVLDTVGGEINANFAVAESLIVDNIELKNFKLTVAPFKKSGIDGLLGMNFFKKFDFKIDQNKQLLYLKLKSREVLVFNLYLNLKLQNLLSILLRIEKTSLFL